MSSGKAGIALMNLGSPASLSDVRGFLRRLFEGIEMFHFPGERLVRPFLAALMAALRAGRVRQRYRLLGGTSPLVPLTQGQAAGLEAALLQRGFDVPVEICMRYSHPFASEAVERLLARGARGIIGFPLYPQYSDSTTGSSLRALRQAVEKRCPGHPCREIESWCDDPDYHAALARRILACRQGLDGAEGVGLLLLAHSIPERFVRKGDPYVEQVEMTVAGVLDALDRELPERLPWLLAYQSQVGPVKWVGPTVQQAVEALVCDGHRNLIVVPVSFVSDHLETLYEIDLHYRRLALELGCERFERIDSLNASDDFVAFLANRVIKVFGGELSTVEPDQKARVEGMT
jgi:ferrochelatase